MNSKGLLLLLCLCFFILVSITLALYMVFDIPMPIAAIPNAVNGKIILVVVSGIVLIEWGMITVLIMCLTRILTVNEELHRLIPKCQAQGEMLEAIRQVGMKGNKDTRLRRWDLVAYILNRPRRANQAEAEWWLIGAVTILQTCVEDEPLYDGESLKHSQ